MNATRQPHRTQEIGDIVALLPVSGAGRRGRMPEMKDPRTVEHRDQPDSARSQAAAKVVVFTAPTEEILVKAVHALKIAAGEREVATAKSGLRGVTDDAVPQRLEMHLAQLGPLLRRGPMCEFPAFDGGQRN